MNVYKINIDTPIGAMMASTSEDCITGLWFVGQKYYPVDEKSWANNENLEIFKLLKQWIKNYFDGKNEALPFKIKMHGTEFQELVWGILRDIPYGQTISYNDISKKVARIKGLKKMSSQAVGGAVGHNPLTLLIPCHRVIGSNNKLTGFAGGLDKKEYLLKLEGNIPK